ncbi:MAG TPA: sugar transferase [Marinospirillum sp.]|uniref:sugar transferase n=1 Tax=Marinospirillum sp. TaxID=2183934 RepID=UPI002B48A490|nr:sugar transferase [Marinospirillum sp.]HKM15984.1 sugar transferase [Marinospirillum sp.]
MGSLQNKLLAALILLLLLPLLFTLALLIRLTSKGPVLFKQQRLGLNKQPFAIYKFRTMRVSAPQVFKAAMPGDMRITKLGHFLRKTSLDELPQLLNVLKGEMALVGPRPYVLEQNQHYERVFANYHLRYTVPPGMTGWAQVKGLRGYVKSDTEMQQRVNADIYYVQHKTLLFDIKIMLRTIIHGFINNQP